MRILVFLTLFSALLGLGCGDSGDSHKDGEDTAASEKRDAGTNSVDASSSTRDATTGANDEPDSGADEDATTPGSGACNLACTRGRHCVVTSSGPSCVSDSADAGTGGTPGSTCAATTCPTGSYCDDISGSAKCITSPSCDTVKCTAGTHCELVSVQCIRAPCPAQPMCTPNSDGGTSGAGVRCGTATCDGGQRCCSATCGICGPARGACPAIACAAP